MPFIDFCFLLIILFVALLSVAYFDPSPTQSIQTTKGDTGMEEEADGAGAQKLPFKVTQNAATATAGMVFDPKAQEEAMEVMRRQMAALTEKLDDAVEKGAALERQLKRVHQSAAKTKAIAGTAAGGADARKLEEMIRQYQRALNENLGLRDRVAKLSQEIETLKKRLKELEAERARLKKELEEARRTEAIFLNSGGQ